MDVELLFSLWVLWLSVLVACILAALMWTVNRGEAFHPHCVDLDRRHSMFEVVKRPTICKTDFAVKSVSAYISPRGSSSDKYFTVLITIMSISGLFGSIRWHRVGDASLTECLLSCVGFLSLILVPVFELDVSNNAFIEEKLAVTVSFLRLLNVYDMLDLNWTQYSPELLDFVRDSPDIKHIYPEAEGVECVHPTILTPGFILHCIGAGSFVAYVTAAVVSNDYTESHVGILVALGLNMFLLLTYFCGTYLPIGLISPALANQGQIFSWNPFVFEKEFLIKLQKAANTYHAKLVDVKTNDASVSSEEKVTRRKKGGKSLREVTPLISEKDMEDNAAATFANCWGMRIAKARPKYYVQVVSYIMLLSELLSLLVPMLAIGCQWMTALCGDTPSLSALFSLTYWSLRCMIGREEDMCDSMLHSCVVASST